MRRAVWRPLLALAVLVLVLAAAIGYGLMVRAHGAAQSRDPATGAGARPTPVVAEAGLLLLGPSAAIAGDAPTFRVQSPR